MLSRALRTPYFGKYEYAIIDSPPSFGFLTLNSMYAADMILVPVDLSYFSFNGIDGVYRVTGLLEKETGIKPPVFFVMNIYDRRSNFAKQLKKDAKRRLGPYLFSTKVRSSVRLREAAAEGKTIFEHAPKCSAASDYYNLASELLVSGDKDAGMIVQQFSLHAPEARTVYVLGDFNGWQKQEANRLSEFEGGCWSGHFTMEKGRYRYKFLVDDRWLRDPGNSRVVANTFGTTDSVLDL